MQKLLDAKTTLNDMIDFCSTYREEVSLNESSEDEPTNGFQWKGKTLNSNKAILGDSLNHVHEGITSDTITTDLPRTN